MFEYFKEYILGIHQMNAGDIIEIDTLDELQILNNGLEALKT